VTDRVAINLRVPGNSERNCKQSVVYITWLDSCDGYHERMYRL